MPLVVWLGAVALSASLPVAWWALTSGGNLSTRVNRQLADRQPTMRQVVLERSATERLLLPLARGLGSRLMRFTPIGWVESKANVLARAGWTGRVTPEQVLGAKLILPMVIGGLMAVRLLGNATFTGALMFVAVVFAAFFLPDLLVRSKADRRAEEITISLPDLLDQLTISVEAGLGFEAALDRIVRNDDGALPQEFGRTLQDIRFGTSRKDALEAMAERAQVDDLKTVILTMRQAEMLGVPLAQTLRNVASEMREKRRYRAEEQANKLPIKMIFPLGLCILPALFVVILGPAVVQFTRLF